MNGLEQFTKEDRAAFDVHTPPADVWNKIKPDLKRKKRMPEWFKYVAAAVVLFAVGFGTGRLDLESNDSLRMRMMARSTQGQEVIENEYYYKTQINDRMQQLQPYFVSDPRLKSDIDVDFQDLDRYCKELKDDLQDNINNEFVIEALIQSYQTKLSILEGLLQQLIPDENENAQQEI